MSEEPSNFTQYHPQLLLTIDNHKRFNMETQSKAILDHLQQGKTITGIEALNDFGCFRLPARICDIKKMGHNIVSEIIKLPNDKRIARYRLVNLV